MTTAGPSGSVSVAGLERFVINDVVDVFKKTLVGDIVAKINASGLADLNLEEAPARGVQDHALGGVLRAEIEDGRTDERWAPAAKFRYVLSHPGCCARRQAVGANVFAGAFEFEHIHESNETHLCRAVIGLAEVAKMPEPELVRTTRPQPFRQMIGQAARVT
jgi:hypothetical protein